MNLSVKEERRIRQALKDYDDVPEELTPKAWEIPILEQVDQNRLLHPRQKSTHPNSSKKVHHSGVPNTGLGIALGISAGLGGGAYVATPAAEAVASNLVSKVVSGIASKSDSAQKFVLDEAAKGISNEVSKPRVDKLRKFREKVDKIKQRGMTLDELNKYMSNSASERAKKIIEQNIAKSKQTDVQNNLHKIAMSNQQQNLKKVLRHHGTRLAKTHAKKTIKSAVSTAITKKLSSTPPRKLATPIKTTQPPVINHLTTTSQVNGTPVNSSAMANNDIDFQVNQNIGQADQELPGIGTQFGHSTNFKLALDLKVRQSIKTKDDRLFYFPLNDDRVFFKNDKFIVQMRDAVYWRRKGVNFKISDVKARLIPKLGSTKTETPVDIPNCKLSMMDVSSHMVSDQHKTYNNVQDIVTMQDLVKASGEGMESHLPKVKFGYKQLQQNQPSNVVDDATNPKDNCNLLVVPDTFPGWHSKVIQPEVEMFSYSWFAKAKMLRKTTEYLKPQHVVITDVPFALHTYDKDKTEPTKKGYIEVKSATIDSFIRHRFDYSSGIVTLPQEGIFAAVNCLKQKPYEKNPIYNDNDMPVSDGLKFLHGKMSYHINGKNSSTM